MLIIVDDEIVHDPAIGVLAESLGVSLDETIGHIFRLAWYLNRYSDLETLPSSIDHKFIGRIFNCFNYDRLFNLLDECDVIHLHKDGCYQIGWMITHYFTRTSRSSLTII